MNPASEGNNKIIKAPKKLAIIRPSMNVKEAMLKMKKLKFERLPVVQENELVGMVTTKDILSFNPEFYPELEELAKILDKHKDICYNWGIKK